MRRADNLTTFMCRLAWNLGASTSWNPQGLSRPVMGLLNLIMWKNSVEPGRPRMSVWRMRVSCWMTNVTNTHIDYVNCFSTATKFARTHVHCLTCLKKKISLLLTNELCQSNSSHNHVGSCIKVNKLTLKRLMSYIYGAPILDGSRSHTTTQHSR